MQSSNYNHFTGKKSRYKHNGESSAKSKTHAHIKTSILAFQRLKTSRKREYTASENNSQNQGVLIMKKINALRTARIGQFYTHIHIKYMTKGAC